MQTSAAGIAAIEYWEGVVRKAYRCPAGIWTIGAGLTAASGVIVPRAGMFIDNATASELLQRALQKNYEPAVLAAMPGAKQHEFDAGVGFHWNTGAIGRATWVKRWVQVGGRATISAALLQWVKASGKIMPGLVRRRQSEAAMLFDAQYPVQAPLSRATVPMMQPTAAWAIPLTPGERARVMVGFYKLGYALGKSPDGMSLHSVLQFQRDHDLTGDGIIGRATLSTLQRQLDARTKVMPTVAAASAPVAAVAVPAGTSDLLDRLLALPHANAALIAAGTVYAGLFVLRYRDAAAAVICPTAPRIARFLRSF